MAKMNAVVVEMDNSIIFPFERVVAVAVGWDEGRGESLGQY